MLLINLHLRDLFQNLKLQRHVKGVVISLNIQIGIIIDELESKLYANVILDQEINFVCSKVIKMLRMITF